MKAPLFSGLVFLHLALPLIVSGQLTPDGDPWNYDDGYVIDDSPGTPPGITWYWGYTSNSQLVDGFLVFHRLTLTESNTAQLITDSYDLNGVFLPSAPFYRPNTPGGPVISDTPISTSIANPPVAPTLGEVVMTPGKTLRFTVSGISNVNYIVQANADLNSTNWVSITTNVAPFEFIDGAASASNSRFYRALYLPPDRQPTVRAAP